MAAAAVSLACPLRRSTRLAHGARRNPEPDTDNDLADELTPRALRALKRQRLALDPDVSRKRRKSPPQRRPKRTQATSPPSPPPPLSIPIPAPAPADADADADAEPEPLTPLTPLTPSPESSPGHDRQPLPLPDPPPPPPLVPPLDTLLPFNPPQLDIQDQFPSFPPHQLYVPPNPVFVRDREINIWKLACQERVDCLLRRYGIDYIKSIVESQARSLSPSPPSQTMFRLYTPASYTYSLSSWASTSTTRKPFPVDEADPAWPIDDVDWVDPDVDMEDEDEDDYEDDEDPPDGDTIREGEATLDAVAPPPVAMQVEEPGPSFVPLKPTELPRPPPDPSPSPIPHAFPPPPLLTPPTLPPLSSLHVPLLSEPPRAFMGRGTPPDRRRLIEWSGSSRFPQNGMGPPLFLSPVSQRHTNPDVGIPMTIDPPIHPPPPLPPHTHGEWTSFLYSMLEGEGVGDGVGSSSASEPTWYELGLASVPPVPDPSLELPLSHHAQTRATVDPPLDEAGSSSTLRFALG